MPYGSESLSQPIQELKLAHSFFRRENEEIKKPVSIKANWKNTKYVSTRKAAHVHNEATETCFRVFGTTIQFSAPANARDARGTWTQLPILKYACQ